MLKYSYKGIKVFVLKDDLSKYKVRAFVIAL